LTLVGLLGFLNPPREDAAKTIRSLDRDGVAVKVLTGDDEQVARQVCSLGVIVEGRRASGYVMKYLLMGMSSNFGNMLSMAAAVAFLPFLPMLPVQILLNNLLYDDRPTRRDAIRSARGRR
jgi:magnesium-transporting ATPase (P-type)